MGKLSAILVSCILLFACDNHKDVKKQKGASDSMYFKNIKYDKLNEFVGYHIFKEGTKYNDSGIIYTLKPVGYYYNYNKTYAAVKHSKTFSLSVMEIKSILLTDTLLHRVGFDGMFKVNSKIAFIYKPYILKRFTVQSKKKDRKDLNVLALKLKSKEFVRSVSIDSLKSSFVDTMINHGKRSVVIYVYVKPAYWKFDRLDSLCNEVNKWPEVEQAVDVRMFNGKFENETFYNVKSRIGNIVAYRKKEKDSLMNLTGLQKLVRKLKKDNRESE
jgi:hypothetical protein